VFFSESAHTATKSYFAYPLVRAAFACHRTQFGPDNLFRRLPESAMAGLLQSEYFALARPDLGNGRLPNDLFDGIN
jgi:hypothetical protein